MNTKKTILITGCSSGFGKVTADHFLTKGWNVIATMRSPKAGLFEENDGLLVTALDVTDPESIGKAVQQGIGRFGKIDVVVNNAGIGLFGAAEAIPDEVIRQIFETNTFGVMAMSRAILPHMRERGEGMIINVTSSVCFSPLPFIAVYAASKQAVEGYSEALAHELDAFGVRVKLVEPGLAPSTAFASNAGGISDSPIPAAYAEGAGRFLQTMHDYSLEYTRSEDVAEAVYQAATDGENKLRYPAGADSTAIAEMRRSLPEEEFMNRVRALSGSAAGPR